MASSALRRLFPVLVAVIGVLVALWFALPAPAAEMSPPPGTSTPSVTPSPADPSAEPTHQPPKGGASCGACPNEVPT
jgi:hypothetical protein